MSDYSEHGAQPVDDAAVERPPTVEEVRARQWRDHPEQAETAEGSVADTPPFEPDGADSPPSGA